MVSLEDLRIPMFASIPEAELTKLLPLVQRRHFEERQAIFKRGEKAEFFGILDRGRALSEYQVTGDVTVSLTVIKPGYVFGWHALKPGSFYEVTVTCLDPSEVLLIPGAKLRELLRRETVLGEHMYRAFCDLLMERVARRTQNLITVLAKHPDLTQHIVMDDE